MRKPEVSAKNSSNINNKLRKGLWSPEEDDKLMNYMLNSGQGCWSDVARNAGLQRCGKSCRLRWINYLRPDLKRGAFSPQEEELIVHLHSLLGNRLPMLDHGLNVPVSGGFFNTTGPCFSTQSGVDHKGLYLENGGVFGSVNIGAEGDMYVPPLESVSTTSDHNLKVESTCNTDTNNSYFDDINSIILNNCSNKRTENRAGVENLFQQELTMGEWDLEELMNDVSSFPFLDFSNIQ
ncbi:transcription factor MYB86-like isoform X2 [Vigna umbellata]|uniref:transcription factor MYB86-like isoform X2 n=1 Tax=Vigna umbellata TaxID=87088 RepID=UPI001F5EEA40|nr:transcription factor MYB86-like isoform X2 [Vigna umbellata]